MDELMHKARQVCRVYMPPLGPALAYKVHYVNPNGRPTKWHGVVA